MLAKGMNALGTEVMAVSLSLRVPVAGSEVTLIAPSVSPASTSANGKSPAENVLRGLPLRFTEPPVEVGASLTGVTLSVIVAPALQRPPAFMTLIPIVA